MELIVLTVGGCPNAAVLDERLAIALASCADVTVERRVIDDEQEAVRLGMRGSPTLLVNRVDPFAAPGVPLSLSCRMYRDPDDPESRIDGAPSVAALRRVLSGYAS